MQQGPSKKDPGGRRTEQKRPVLENVPPWRCGCTHGLHGTREQKPQDARFPPRARAGKEGLGWLAGRDLTHQGPCAFDHYLLS